MFFKTDSGIRSFTWYINAAVLASLCDGNEIRDLKVISSCMYILKNLIFAEGSMRYLLVWSLILVENCLRLGFDIMWCLLLSEFIIDWLIVGLSIFNYSDRVYGSFSEHLAINLSVILFLIGIFIVSVLLLQLMIVLDTINYNSRSCSE